MAIVLIYFHSDDSLHDFKLFTRKLYPSRFESCSRVEYSEETQRLFLVQSREVPTSSLSLFDYTPELCPYDHGDYYSSSDSIPGSSNCCCFNKHQLVKLESYFQLCPCHKLCLTLDSHAAACAAHELALSRIFRKKFIKYAKSIAGMHSSFDNVDSSDEIGIIWIPFVIEIQLEYPKQKIDYSWFYRIQSLIILKLKSEEAMALLSTLGGGFSALGDYYERHSLEAGKIALRQLKIALTICDPLIAARCYLYVALSLMQRGYLRESKDIIRKQYLFAKGHFIKDYRLIAMCKGLWARLKFMYYLRKLERQGIPCNVQHGILSNFCLNYNVCNILQLTNGQDESIIQMRVGAS